MTAPSVTYTFTNGTVADADQVNTNFTNIINALTDGTKTFSIDALTCAGTVLLNGAVTLGNATGDDITVTGYLASNLISKTTNTYALGSSSLLYSAVYSTLFLAGDGSAAAPAYSFNSSGSGDNGMYLSAANEVSLATAGTQRVVVDANGAFGIGVSAVEANYKSEISHTGRLLTRITSTDAGADIGPYLVLMRNSSSPAASDSIGAVAFSGKNASAAEVTYARIGAIITDTTAGSEDADLVFSNNKAGTVTESMRILSAGNVGIGTAAPTNAKLEIYGAVTTIPLQFIKCSETTGTYRYIDIVDGAGSRCGDAVVNTDANTMVWGTSSDARLKTNLRTFNALELVNQITPYKYERTCYLGHDEIGFLAQNVHSVFPEAVTVGGEDENKDPWMVDYGRITPVLLQAIKEQQAIITAQGETINSLVSRLDSALAEIKELKAKVG